MATQSLDITSIMTSADTVSGIFSLNNTNKQTVTFDNTNVSSATTELTTGYVEYITASVSENTYVYIKNLSTTSNVLMANAGSQEWGIVLPGEWNFFTVVGGKGLEFKGSASGVDIEYALFRKP